MADDKAKYEISLVDKYSKKLGKISKETSAFDNQVASLGKTMAGVFAAGAVVSGMVRLTKWSSRLAGDMEQTEIAFNTFLGSAEKGRQVLENLNEFANRTPFTNAQIIKTGRSLLAANVPAEKMTSTLQMIGDIAAGTKVPITDLGNIYAKVMNKGKLQAEELNQLAERGVPIIDQLSKEFGVTKQEVFKLGSEGKITSGVMVKAFKSMTGQGGKFFKLMEKQSKSAVGLMSTLEGKTELLGISLGKRLLPTQKSLTRQTIRLVDTLNDWVKIPAADAIRDEQMEVNKLVLRLRDANTSEEDRKAILTQLRAINPKVVEGITAENLETEKLTRNLGEYNREAAKRIVLANLTEDEQKQAVKQADALARKIQAEDDIRTRLARTRMDEVEAGGDLVGLAQEEVKVRKAQDKMMTKANQGLNNNSKIAKGNRSDIRKLNSAIDDLSQARKDLNKAEAKSFDISERANRLRKLLGLDAGGGLKTKDVVTGKIEGADDVEAGITKITAAAPKVFNINIGNLVENFEVSTTNLQEGEAEVRDVVTRALLEGLADVQPLVR